MEKTDKSAEDYWFDFSNHETQMITEANFKAAIRVCQKDCAAPQLSEYKEIIKELLPFARSVVYNTSISTEEGRKNVREIQVVIDRAKKLID